MTETERLERLDPLLPSDPPRLGAITVTGRLEVTDGGLVYGGQLADRRVAVAVLSKGAELDSFARARFYDVVADARTGGQLAVLAADDDHEIAPWAAVPAPTWAEGARRASALLAAVTLAPTAPATATEPEPGPHFRPHWQDRHAPGRWRSWPLPWPAATATAGRWTYLASFALVLAIASLALFVAVRLFSGMPPAPVTPPFPQVTSGGQTRPPPSPSPPPSVPRDTGRSHPPPIV